MGRRDNPWTASGAQFSAYLDPLTKYTDEGWSSGHAVSDGGHTTRRGHLFRTSYIFPVAGNRQGGVAPHSEPIYPSCPHTAVVIEMALPNMTKCPRRQIMIDQSVQGSLIARVVLYWLLCLLATAGSAWCWTQWRSDAALESVLPILVPALLGSLTVLPLAIADVLRVSSRFVGPVHSIRNALKRVDMGDSVSPLKLRKGDHWSDLVTRFNQLLDRIEDPNEGDKQSQSPL